MPSRKKWRIAGINFDFRHMDQLLGCVQRERNAELVGISHHDPAEMQDVIAACEVPEERVFTDWRRCIEETKPDVVVLCPASGAHAEWVEQVAAYGVHVLIEKPFTANLAQADRMVKAMKRAKRRIAINWPLAWYPSHRTAHRLLQAGRIGELQEVHFYDGNRSPIWNRADPKAKAPIRGTANVSQIKELELTTAKGTAKLPLKGMWFPDGFRGTLGEFLRAIEEDRESSINARSNLRSLELCFAALESAETGLPVRPGKVLTSRL